MLKKVDHIFIGKDIDRTSTIIADVDIMTAQSDAAEGEIFVLGEDYKVVTAPTYSTDKVIYIAEGSSETFTTTYPSGTTLSGRRLLLSPAIDGKRVTNYIGAAYSAKSEAVATIPSISDTIVSGTEYVLRIVYKGYTAALSKGQSTDTFRYTATSSDTSSTIYDEFVTKINNRYKGISIKKNKANLISATNNSGTLTITALPLLDCTTSLDDNSEFAMQNFAVFFNYVDNDYNWEEVGLSDDITYTGADKGNGIWETIRDTEKRALAYEGVTNYTHFPVVKPDLRTIKNGEYNTITIEHDAQYRSSDNQYNKETSLCTQLALAVEADATTTPQTTAVLTTLNTWMASLPTAFSNVSFS